MTDKNRWSRRADLANEMMRPDLGHSPIGDGERRIGLGTIAEALGDLWSRDRRVTPDVVALLDALARLV